MQLELISRTPGITAKPLPLLFVHGAFACASIWDEYFLSYFAARGYAAYAVSLRGHGASAGRGRLRRWRLADYVEDIGHTIAALGQPPVLIGHSLGGMVAQKYLESHSAPGLVLMASAPPQGLLPSLWGMAAANPLLVQQLGLLQLYGPQLATLPLMRSALFSASTPDASILRYARFLQGESIRVALDLLGLDPLRRGDNHTLPMLVLGAEQDAFFSPGLIRDTARYYDAEVVIFPGMAHAMMLETGWEQVAAQLAKWLETRFG